MNQSTLSSFQQNNIVTLFHYMKSLPKDYEHFNMRTYNSDSAYADVLPENSCGTSACLAGHGPNAGIAPLDNTLELWNDYVTRVFCPVFTSAVPYRNSDEFDLLFVDDWDNDIDQALTRMKYFILNGFVVDPDIMEAMRYDCFSVAFDLICEKIKVLKTKENN